MHFTPERLQRLGDAIRCAPLELLDARIRQKVNLVLQDLQLDTDHVVRIQDVFQDEMQKGIQEAPSSLQMENTYIPELPDGTEEGQYLALDLGGTNFRVLLMQLRHGHVVSEQVQHYQVAAKLRVGDGEALFDFLAECIAHFVVEKGVADVRLPLGFTFSFPMTQKGLDAGVLVTWTKTFNCPSVVGRDVVQLLRDALERRGDTHVEVLAILNDTTGTLVQGAVLDPRTAIGLILGTGSNACYLERADRVQHWEAQRHGEKQVIIDIEWGAFGDNGVLDFVRTVFDRRVDSTSIIAQSFTFEKYISGKYMGEIVRVILVQLHSDGLLFNEAGSLGELAQHGAFTTSFVSQVELDSVEGGSKHTTQILAALGVNCTDDDAAVVKHVCAIVSNRAALLVAICLSALLERMDREDTTIAVDGSLYKHHPKLGRLIEKYISLLTDKKFQLLLAEDGSGKGAGIVAAIALKLRQRFLTT